MPKNTACLACGYALHYPVYHPEDQPLAALNLPNKQPDAINAPRYPMNFHACARCGHIYNIAFDYSKVPYEKNSNLMYNRGSGWQVYIQELIDRLHKHYPFTDKTVVEIGCGDGHFLVSLREKFPSLRCIGFEPGIDPLRMKEAPITMVNDYFVAERDLPNYKPDLIVCRHVIEHLEAPRDFAADISYWCNMHQLFPYFLVEVPRINNAIAQSRINDYLYEHVSNFTDTSLRLMLESAGFDILEYNTAYGGEVLVTLVKPKEMPQLQAIGKTAEAYRQAILSQHKTVYETLDKWRSAGKRIAFWGGTGKGAAFLNGFKLSYEHYPIVIDSDPHKTGKFVPGMGQEIRPPEYLHAQPVDIIVITTQWRAADICEEIKQRKITCGEIYVVRNQMLEKLSSA